MEGVEPTHSYEYQILSLARLPIPPHRLLMRRNIKAKAGKVNTEIWRGSNPSVTAGRARLSPARRAMIRDVRRAEDRRALPLAVTGPSRGNLISIFDSALLLAAICG